MPTIEERKLKFIGRQTDKVRKSVIDFYIEPPLTSGPRCTSKLRHLIARYETGGHYDLPIVEGRREFATAIPNEWSEERVLQELIGDIDPVSPPASETRQ